MFNNKKGFTLIELIAVIVIIGILILVGIPSVQFLINKSKNENIEASRDTLEMAAKSYAVENKKILPKSIGQIKEISIKDLRDSNYLKEDIKNANNESCMKYSYVRIFKYDKDKYKYITYLYCGSEKPDKDNPKYRPSISVKFTDDNDQELDFAKNNVTRARVKINFKAGLDEENKKVGLQGYSYIVLVKFETESDYLEIYNSGSLNAYGKETIDVNKSISEYINVKGATNIRVIAEAYDKNGNSSSILSVARYNDREAPKCGEVIGEAKNPDDWDSKLKRRTISVKCNDEGGSGCVRDEFTKTFTEEGEFGYITIKDNAGNETECKVRVNLDYTPPTLTIKAYRRNADGTNLFKEGEVTANKDNPKAELKKYSSGNGDDSWLNSINFPYGINYEVTVDDNIKIDGKTYTTGTLITNIAGRMKDDSTGKKLSFENYDKNAENIKKFYFAEDGFRRAKYTLVDKAGNKVSIDIIAPIDIHPPTEPKVNFYKNNSGRLVTSSRGLTVWRGCNSWSNKAIFAEATGSNDNISGLDYYSYFVYGTGIDSKGKTENKSYYNFIDVEGQFIFFNACDKAGNCSELVPKDACVISVDTKPPKCTLSATAGGKPYSLGSWTNQNVTVTATCSDKGGSDCVEREYVRDYGVGSGNTLKVSFPKITFEDNAGNSVDCQTGKVQIDKAKPTCGNKPNVSWTNSDRKLKIKCSDIGSGCKKTKFPKTFSVEAGKCLKTGSITIEDKVGNSTKCTVNVYIDKKPPIIKCYYKSETCPHNAAISQYFDCGYFDSCSGLKKSYVKWGKGRNVRDQALSLSGSVSNDILCTVDTKAAGAIIYTGSKYFVEDNVGNRTNFNSKNTP